MEQKSIRVLETNKTFFSKLTTGLTKLLIPTKVGFNSIVITIKRNNLIKVYNNYKETLENDNSSKKETIAQKYEDVYALYLEAIDKYIMDSVYKKVKNNSATEFEKQALAKYYMIISLKEKQYLEYKYKKQEYLLKVDYETVSHLKKESTFEKYNDFYVSKMDTLYKGLLKNYSIQLADTVSTKIENVDNIYTKIFNTLENYIEDILPIKINQTKSEEYKKILEEYESTIIGKLDERDILKKKITILSISRCFFTHSLPLIAAEQCYIKLIKEARELILKSDNKARRNKSYETLFDIIENYNIKLLSTKVYWNKPSEREEYKQFWTKYDNLRNLKETEQIKQKQILFLRYDIKKLNKSKNNAKIIKLHKDKLVELGAMKELSNILKTVNGNYKKVKKQEGIK